MFHSRIWILLRFTVESEYLSCFRDLRIWILLCFSDGNEYWYVSGIQIWIFIMFQGSESEYLLCFRDPNLNIYYVSGIRIWIFILFQESESNIYYVSGINLNINICDLLKQKAEVINLVKITFLKQKIILVVLNMSFASIYCFR